MHVPERDGRLLERFEAAFDPAQPPLWSGGLALAHDLGAAAAPLLERAAAEESDVRRRLLLVAAWSIAAGSAAHAPLARRLTAAVGSQGGDRREQLVALVALAMGAAPAARSLPALDEYARRVREPLFAAGASFALARFPDAAGPQSRWLRADAEPGLRAAARFCAGASWSPRSVDRALRGGPDVATQAWLRGTWLGATLGPFDAERAEVLADGLRTRSAGTRDLQLAAALHLTTADQPAQWLDAIGDVGADVSAVLVEDPRFRRLLFERGELGLPPDWIGPAARGRLALAVALEADLDTLRQTRGEWQRNAALAEVLCLGLAWRLLDRAEPAEQAWVEAVPEVREQLWVRYACGVEPPTGAGRTFDDPALDRAWLIAARGGRERLPPAAARAALEDALWRRGAHFGVVRPQAEADLLRDVLLAGSQYGTARLALGRSDVRDLLPRGLEAGSFAYEIAFELWSFLRAPGPARPSRVRLR